MNHFAKYLILFSFIAMSSCKQDASSTAVDNNSTVVEDDLSPADFQQDLSTTLFAALDRLRIRTDSSLQAGTVVTISERDSLVYLGQMSKSRLALKLRSKYHYEPWLKVKHVSSGKTGWVYGGAVKYESPQLKKQLSENALWSDQIYADDLEWEGIVPTSWGTATINDPASFKTFMIYFKELVRKNEVAAIADLVQFPLKDIETKDQFMDNYTNVMTGEIREAVKNQRLDRIYRDRKGAVIGEDELVFREMNGHYKLVDIAFKSRVDIIADIMQNLTATYMAKDEKVNSITAFAIKYFLELTLHYEDGRSQSLGKYVYETTKNNTHTFREETPDSLQRQVRFIGGKDFVELRVSGSEELNLDLISFQALKK